MQRSGQTPAASRRAKTEEKRQEKLRSLDDPCKLSEAVRKYKDVERTILDKQDPTDSDLNDFCTQALGRNRAEVKSRLAVLAMVKRYMGIYETDKQAWIKTGVSEGTFKDLKPDFKTFVAKWKNAWEKGEIGVKPPDAMALLVLADGMLEKVQQAAGSRLDAGPSTSAPVLTAQADESRDSGACTSAQPWNNPNEGMDFCTDDICNMLNDEPPETAHHPAAGGVASPCAPSLAHPCATRRQPALRNTPSPTPSTTPIALPLDGREACCSFPECRKPCYVKKAVTGELHDYCGRRHATLHRRALGVPPPWRQPIKCRLGRCSNSAFYDEQTGRQYICCSRRHYAEAVANKEHELPRTVDAQPDALKCAQPACRSERFGRHEYCSKTCAATALLAGCAIQPLKRRPKVL